MRNQTFGIPDPRVRSFVASYFGDGDLPENTIISEEEDRDPVQIGLEQERLDKNGDPRPVCCHTRNAKH